MSGQRWRTYAVNPGHLDCLQVNQDGTIERRVTDGRVVKTAPVVSRLRGAGLLELADAFETEQRESMLSEWGAYL